MRAKDVSNCMGNIALLYVGREILKAVEDEIDKDKKLSKKEKLKLKKELKG